MRRWFVARADPRTNVGLSLAPDENGCTAHHPAPAAPLLVTRLSGIGSAQRVIAVGAPGYGTSYATLTAYERRPSGWTQVFGPWTANIGRNGVALYA